MTSGHDIIDTILFSESLSTIQQRLLAIKKPAFGPNDRIVIVQNENDTYPYVDSAGVKLIELQKIINEVDISNCFILLVTPNSDVASEIDFITRFYSIDPIPINFLITNGEYKKEIAKYNNTACRKLWNHLYIGPDNNVNPCCVANHRFPMGNIMDGSIDSIFYSDKANQIRNWMSQGYRSFACSTCYSKEDNGITSLRQRCDPATQKIKINSLDIRINNICNFKCRMCSEYFSSAIQQETIELYGKNTVLGHEQISLVRTSAIEKQSVFRKIFPYLTHDLKDIYFAGGEPLISSEHYQILDRLIDINHKTLKISYNTNLSQLTYKGFDAIDYWNQFDDVTVGASIDADGAAAEYMRHGTIWTKIKDNISIIKNRAPGTRLQITSTVSFLTIENLIKLQTKWLDERYFDVDDLKVNVLANPDYLSPGVLPQHHKKRLASLINDHVDRLGKTTLASQWQDVLKFMNNNDYSHCLDDFRRRTSTLDKHRHESFLDVFPEFQDLYA